MKADLDIRLWHRRLGHALAGALKQLFSLVYNECKGKIDNCNVCPLAKHCKLSFSISSSRVEDVFHLLHVDVWGPYVVQTFDGNKLFLTIVDDHSRMSWVYLLKLKRDVLILLRNLLKLVQTQFNRQVKVIELIMR